MPLEARSVSRGLTKQFDPARAWGMHLSAFAWAHVAHLTYGWEVTPEQAFRDFRERFIRRASKSARRPLQWFVAVERAAAGRAVHMHALLAGTERLLIAQLERAWRAGSIVVEPYDLTRGAAYYVAKSITERHDWYDVSRRRLLLGVNPAAANDLAAKNQTHFTRE
jgi:hypothetical protein